MGGPRLYGRTAVVVWTWIVETAVSAQLHDASREGTREGETLQAR